MAADFSMQAIISQQIQNLYRQVKSLSCSNTTEILKTGAMVDKMLMQYRDNVELLILQTHLEILNSREQRARAIASRVWELGGNISLVFEKMYLDDLINLGMLEMSMLLIKPHFENLEEDIEVLSAGNDQVRPHHRQHSAAEKNHRPSRRQSRFIRR